VGSPGRLGIAVAGVACLTDAVINIVRIMLIPKENFFGAPIGVSVGWGLWLVAFSSAVMCVTAAVVATQIAKSIEMLRPLGESGISWPERWRWVAIITSALIVIAGVVYAWTHPWKDQSRGGESSPTTLPSFPSFSSSANPSTTTSSTSSQPSKTPAGSARANVVVGGETLYVGDDVVCSTIRQGAAINIRIGDTDSKGASVYVTSGDTPQVEKMGLFGVDGELFIYDPSGPAGGPVYAFKNGDSYTITGSVISAQAVSKQFDTYVRCH
jgi:hypothetical protein